MLQQTTNRLHSGPPTLSLQQDWEAGVAAPILQSKAAPWKTFQKLLLSLSKCKVSSVQSFSRVQLFATP